MSQSTQSQLGSSAIRRVIFFASLFALSGTGPFLTAQQVHLDSSRKAEGEMSPVDTTSLSPALKGRVERALKEGEYIRAETILVDEIRKDPTSFRLLALAGGVFFLDGKYLRSAIAYNKAAALAPLDDRSRFTLAMSYIKLNRNDWARPELEALAQSHPRDALYPYWLSRLDYDGMSFVKAIGEVQKAIKLDPAFTRAYENLGLCYEALGQYDQAVSAYEDAARLNRAQRPASSWPPLSLGALLVKMDKLDLARTYLSEALSIDPRSPEAHYQFGLVLEKQHRDPEALGELRRAAQLRPSYAEPYYAMGKLYQRTGETHEARRAFATFEKLKGSETHESSR